MELEYEGDPAFLTGGIEALLVTMGSLAGSIPTEMPLTSPTTNANGAAQAAQGHSGTPTFTTATLAAHRGAKTGPELLICALARLEFVQGKSSSSRAEILTEMKSATAYYNKNMAGNLTSIFTSLTSTRRIREIVTDSYALSATERKQVEAKVAEIG